MTMSSPDSSLALVITHGAWHVAAHTQPLVDAAHARNIPSTSVQLPTCAVTTALNKDAPAHPAFSAPPPAGGLPDHFADAAAIRAAVDTHLAQGKKVLMVAHSYSGVPVSEAVVPEVTLASRRKEGKAGGVLGVFFLNALAAPPGLSEMGWLGEERAVKCSVVHQPSLLATVTQPEWHLFEDLPEADAARWADMLVPHAVAPHFSVVRNAGWMHVPCAYLLGTRDRMTVPGMQEDVVSMLKENGADLMVLRENVGHSAHLSETDMVLERVLGFARAVLGRDV